MGDGKRGRGWAKDRTGQGYGLGWGECGEERGRESSV